MLKVVYDTDKILIYMGDQGVELTIKEGIQLCTDLSHALQDIHVRLEEKDVKTD